MAAAAAAAAASASSRPATAAAAASPQGNRPGRDPAARRHPRRLPEALVQQHCRRLYPRPLHHQRWRQPHLQGPSLLQSHLHCWCGCHVCVLPCCRHSGRVRAPPRPPTRPAPLMAVIHGAMLPHAPSWLRHCPALLPPRRRRPTPPPGSGAAVRARPRRPHPRGPPTHRPQWPATGPGQQLHHPAWPR